MASDNIIELNSENFDAQLKEVSIPLLVDFWAAWCGPCKAISPILDELADEMKDRVVIAKVNVDDNSELAARYNVRSIPTMLIFKKGEIVEEMVGLSNKMDLQAKLEAHI